MIERWEVFRARRDARVQAKKLDRALRGLTRRLDHFGNLTLGFVRDPVYQVGPEVGKTRDYSIAMDRAQEIKRQLRSVEDSVWFSRSSQAEAAITRSGRLVWEWLLALQYAEKMTAPAVRARTLEAELALERVHSTVHAELLGARPTSETRWASPAGSGRAARQLVALAVLVLPAHERARYAEEFRAELCELRLARMRYALRLVAHSWSLRRILR
jgi:hypothetical protein